MVLTLKYYNNPCLRKKCSEVEITDEVKAFAEELKETMLVNNGIGLAAPQVGVPWRIFIGALGDDDEGESIFIPPKAYINPKITYYSKETRIMNEGCMSIPGLYLDVKRPSVISIEAYDEKGEYFKLEKVSGWRARNLQHEFDHLDGVLHIDRLPERKRRSIEKQLEQLDRKYNCPAPVFFNQNDLNNYFS